MCAPSAAIGGVSSVLQGFAGASQARAENARRKQEYQRALEIRKRNWLQKTSLYSAKVNKYTIDLNENDLAANRAYAKAQYELSAKQGAAIAANETSYMKMVRDKLGKVAASGQTGRSAARLETMVLAEYGRQVGRRAYALTRSGEAYRENVEGIRRTQLSNRNKLYSSVAFTPVPGLAPNPPQMQNTTMPLLQGFLGAAKTGAEAWEAKQELNTGLGGGIKATDSYSSGGSDMWNMPDDYSTDWYQTL